MLLFLLFLFMWVNWKRAVRHGTQNVCSGTCIRFAAYAICARTIAVAESDGLLADFVRFYKATNQRPPSADALIHMENYINTSASSSSESLISANRTRTCNRTDTITAVASTFSANPDLRPAVLRTPETTVHPCAQGFQVRTTARKNTVP